MSNQNLKYLVAFNQVISIGPVRLQRLLDYFPDPEKAWQASADELEKAGLEPKVLNEMIYKRKEIDPDQELERLEKLGIKAVTIFDDYYPKLLKEIYAAPTILYYYGDFDLNGDFPLAVVGSRKMSYYGEEVTKQLVGELINSGLTIISGLALGIDACAQETALKNGGKTIGVLGGGLNQIYPATNKNLAEKIVNLGGAIISEFPLDMPALKHNFPQRNRIISGLSLGTLVAEAAEKSGALITAKYALEQNREVFAVPGNIYQKNSVGPNNLIKMGAKSVTGIEDILETLNLEKANVFKQAKKMMPETETEKMLLDFLSAEPAHVDKLAKSARLDISIINATLAIMEMKGLIKHLGGQKYIKAR